MPSHPSPRGSNFRRFFDVRRRKNGDNLEFSVARKNCVFSDGPKLLLRKIPQKNDFFGEFSRIHFSSFILFLVMFLHCAFWAVHDFRRSVRKNCIFSDRKNDVFSGIRKNVVFSSHGSRMTVRKNPGYLAGWLSGWLASYLAGWLAIWLALWLAIWLSRWLVGHLAGGLAGQQAGWLASWLAGFLAGYLAGWLCGWLACWLFGLWLLAGWLAIWLASYLDCWLAIWLADWVVTCSLAG